jgi:tetratricopeptide (TPR) repeat protein
MRAGPWTARAFVLVASLACIAPLASFGEAPAARPSVALALLGEAQAASNLGDWSGAGACLDEAARQDPSNSDILYLRALVSLRRGEPFAPALGDLNAALLCDRFASYAAREARVLKAELLSKERRWEEALEALGNPGGDRAADPAFHLARAKALWGAGDSRGFLAEIDEGLRRFPEDGSFARLFIAKAGRIPPSERSRALGDAILGRLKVYAAADPELPLLAAPLMPDIGSRRDAVLAFRSIGGRSPKASLRALEYGIIDEKTASSELLLSGGTIAQEDLSALSALAGSPDGRTAVWKALADWSGTVLVDADYDGVYEAKFTMVNGLVQEWERDSRQEGFIDERAGFSDGMPREVRLRRADEETIIGYSEYPAVSSIAFLINRDRRLYAFAPESFAFAPLNFTTFLGSGKDSILLPRSSNAVDPTERSVALAASSVETRSGDRREVVALDRGLPASAVTYSGDRLIAKREYEKGRPTLERADEDGDGRFETEKSFAPEGGPGGGAGTWGVAWIRIDVDGDGVFEYREQTRFPFLKEWDYDGNGSMDARRETLADGSVKESYSSKLDGRLDEEIVLKNGKVVSVSRDRERLDLIPDSNRQVTWIGYKPFDLGAGLPDGAGIFSHLGVRYRLTRIGAFAFAELIP